MAVAAAIAVSMLLTAPAPASATRPPLADSADAVATPVVTRHHLVVDGKELTYSAEVGTLRLSRDNGTPYVELFYVAYRLDGASAAKRPLSFIYNGGPGVATLWMHIGGVGPFRLSQGDAAAGRPLWSANPSTILDKSDLVFIDAPEAGFSRLVGDGKIEEVGGIDQDIDAFARFIETYSRRSGRWQSPKYIFGESYGTPRSAGLAAALHKRGISLKGVILQSTVLNYNRRASGMDINYAVTLPSFAAIAWHFGMAPQTVSQQAFIAEARAFAAGPYLEALFEGDALPDEKALAVSERLAHFTGLDAGYIRQANLRISVPRFRKQLLRDRGLILGRYDARATGADDDAAGDQPSWDPSDDSDGGSYTATFLAYLRDVLGYEAQLPYRRINYPLNRAWSQRHEPFMSGSDNGAAMPLADMTVDLGAVMRADPHLWIFAANGLYDLGTPFTGARHDLDHLGLSEAMRRRVRFEIYPAGHMIYTDDRAIGTLKSDLARFYDDSCSCR